GVDFDPLVQDRTFSAGQDTLQSFPVCRAMLRWNDELRHRPSYCFRAGPAERSLRLAIPLNNRASIVHADKSVVGRFDNRLRVFIPLPQGFCGFLPTRDVTSHLSVAEQAPRRVMQGGQDNFRPKARAVLAHPPTFLFDSAFDRGPLEQLLDFS